MSKGLASRAQSMLGPRVSDRYLRFLEREQYEHLEYLHIFSRCFEGWFLPNFCDHRSLYDMERLGRVSGVRNLTRGGWQLTFPNLAPLAILETVLEETGTREAGGLLAMGLQPRPCAVFLVNELGRRCIPVANTLDAFIRGRSWQEPESP